MIFRLLANTISKPIAAMVVLSFLSGSVYAQVDRDDFEQQRRQMREQFDRQQGKARQQFDDARKRAEAEYAAFRKKANAEFAVAMQRDWRHMGVEPAIPKPKEPAPPRPSKPPVDQTPIGTPLPKGEVKPPIRQVEPVPLPAIPEPQPMAPTMQFSFYGVPCSVHTESSSLRFNLPSLDERSIAKVWEQLSSERYDGVLHDCIEQRGRLQLSDWGYIQMVGKMSEKLLGKGRNEAVLLQMYLLAQSGYNVRIARCDANLVLLVPFNEVVYNYSYVTIDNIKYYILAPKGQGGVFVCDVKYPREQVANIMMSRLPNLSGGAKRNRILHSYSRYNLNASVDVEQNLIDYLNDYPLSSAWNYYALAGLSDGVKAKLYPALRSLIDGKSKKEAAGVLLDFMHMAFDYATDQDQFGYERPLFADESIYYPKNDCEDRSIFYAILVRDLLKLDVALVVWPGHLATAVNFGENVEGDYFTYNGRRYTICDPTYLGASVGMTMPQFKNTSASLIEL